MRLPNANRAFIDIEKLRNYCLSYKHPRGRNKARLFELLIGLTAERANLLYETISKSVLVNEAQLGHKDTYGQRYIVDFKMAGKDNMVTVRTTWIIRQYEDFPRLTSCYIL